MIIKILAEKIIDEGAHASTCPCGCRFKTQDHRLFRIRLIETVRGREVETAKSADGGGVWFGVTWMVVTDPAAQQYLAQIEVPA